MNLQIKNSVCFLLLLFCASAQAQHGYTMNFMSQIPHQSKLNPAYSAKSDAYFGIPGLSAIHAEINNDAFSISRLFRHRGDTAVININNFLGDLHSTNNLGFELSADILNFGFKIGEKNYIHLGLSVEGYANAQITKNTFNFLMRGQGFFINEDENKILSGNSIDLNLYGVLSVGYTRKVTEKLNLGARVKFLSGMANLYTENSDISVKINNDDPDITPYTYTLKSNVSMMGSFANSPKDSNLLYALRNMGSSIGVPSSLTQNFGLGFDFGATYQIHENLMIGASLCDVGYINWKTNVKRIASQGDEKPFVFSGVGHLEDVLNDKDFDLKNALDRAQDSLISYLQLDNMDSNFSSYRSKLRTTYNISAFYNLTENDQIGLMWKSQIGHQKNQSLTFAYVHFFGTKFSICLNNAIINATVFNFGGGFALKAGNLQFHLIVDKISAFRVIKMRAANIQFGLNVLLNRTEKTPEKRRSARKYTPAKIIPWEKY